MGGDVQEMARVEGERRATAETVEMGVGFQRERRITSPSRANRPAAMSPHADAWPVATCPCVVENAGPQHASYMRIDVSTWQD